MLGLTEEQVKLLIEKAHCIRDKAIIALFTESGLRLSELTNIKPQDIDLGGIIQKSNGQRQKRSVCTIW